VSSFENRALDMASERSHAASSAVGAVLDFYTVYEAEFDYVYRVVVRLAGDPDVDDLVQEVFLVVRRRLLEFRGDARLTTWLFRIAHRVVGAYVRKERLRRRFLAFVGLEPILPAPALEEATHDTLLVRRALECLSFDKRTALILFEVEEWSAPEIAEALSIPVGTVHTRLYHARAAFRRELERIERKESSR
jgi:RNA polymerase sigma-70 factor (ECF subfamily)